MFLAARRNNAFADTFAASNSASNSSEVGSRHVRRDSIVVSSSKVARRANSYSSPAVSAEIGSRSRRINFPTWAALWLSRGDGPSRLPRVVSAPLARRRAALCRGSRGGGWRGRVEGCKFYPGQWSMWSTNADRALLARSPGCAHPVATVTARQKETSHARRNRP